ncbi:pyridoxal phosphate-dependent aminotransferase [Murimonas intestini]|uniref:Aminotransferase n=1 Tax=Murimonas intestini TaxID=1337051 RepID=A0AB73T003_9FIRM|nr:pyridoxal phosphate-dependent aminotransferase [Murimonas intestini]MCR1843221.1 pyridoxal phosphate-dependent aminotransferase [Murimonas intestini]MCR1868550.1 pyridoxal phosphate-dependent aminotransferase [Murimonas intestini]MCR1885119.1 pyridoxal phosphate-dependent aminotransferase [Murimonas intestini]
MIADKMKGFVKNSSAIRAMFEEGKKMASVYGAENVYDFSLGNPNVAPPEKVKEAIEAILKEENPLEVHGYMNNSGYEGVRSQIAESLNERFGTAFGAENILMTVGAAGGLNVILKSILNPQDEVITFAPYFGEYRSYVENYDGILRSVPPHAPDFQPDLAAFEEMINGRTKAVIINTPNNPTGVIYSEETITRMADILNNKQKEFGTDIYLIADEPYRELAYDGLNVPYLTKYYDNTVVGYSYSKSLSLPGERIGYLVIPDEAADSEELRAAANVANRILGFVNAPSLFQKVVARCTSASTDIEYYDRNRKLLYSGLSEMGYECVKPEGAFYLFVKSPLEDEKAFCEAAKKYHILIVPGSSFACPGYVRIAYCVAYETIEKALPYFRKLAEEYINN